MLLLATGPGLLRNRGSALLLSSSRALPLPAGPRLLLVRGTTLLWNSRTLRLPVRPGPRFVRASVLRLARGGSLRLSRWLSLRNSFVRHRSRARGHFRGTANILRLRSPCEVRLERLVCLGLSVGLA